MTPVPEGPGLVARRVRLAQSNVVLLGAILSGEDHLASIHGAQAPRSSRVTIAVLTTSSRAIELDVWLAELAGPLELELLDP